MFTGGIGNLFYAWYHYSVNPNRVTLRADGQDYEVLDPEGPRPPGDSMTESISTTKVSMRRPNESSKASERAGQTTRQKRRKTESRTAQSHSGLAEQPHCYVCSRATLNMVASRRGTVSHRIQRIGNEFGHGVHSTDTDGITRTRSHTSNAVSDDATSRAAVGRWRGTQTQRERSRLDARRGRAGVVLSSLDYSAGSNR